LAADFATATVAADFAGGALPAATFAAIDFTNATGFVAAAGLLGAAVLATAFLADAFFETALTARTAALAFLGGLLASVRGECAFTSSDR
jgi:hypothetical protein